MLGMESFEGSTDKHTGEIRLGKLSTFESGQERTAGNKFCKYFDEEDERSQTSSTSSSKHEQSPTSHLENEEGLPESFSPKVKIEIPSPSSHTESERSCKYQTHPSGRDYLVKGKIFCQSAYGGSPCRSPSQTSWNGSYSSCFSTDPHIRSSLITNQSMNERHYSYKSSCRENVRMSALNSDNSTKLPIYEESNLSKRTHNSPLLSTSHSVHHNLPIKIWEHKKGMKCFSSCYLQNGCSQDPPCFKSCGKFD